MMNSTTPGRTSTRWPTEPATVTVPTTSGTGIGALVGMAVVFGPASKVAIEGLAPVAPKLTIVFENDPGCKPTGPLGRPGVGDTATASCEPGCARSAARNVTVCVDVSEGNTVVASVVVQVYRTVADRVISCATGSEIANAAAAAGGLVVGRLAAEVVGAAVGKGAVVVDPKSGMVDPVGAVVVGVTLIRIVSVAGFAP